MSIRRVLGLGRDERGAAIIELALVAPVFALMTIGIVDMSNAFSRKLALEQAAQRAIEKVMQTTQLSTVQDTLKTEACDQVDGVNADGSCKNTPITTDNVTVTFRQECTDASGNMTTHTSTDADTFDAFTCDAGPTKEAKYIAVTVTDTYMPLFPVHFFEYNSTSRGYDLSATAGVRTK
ncbi:MAG: pilus assembly protein [Sphingomonas sp.]|nr:pilus assembly protein [Sphingomonas sp.]